MLETISKYFIVYIWSTVKFIFGPVTASLTGVPLLHSIILTAAGMMTTVVVLTYIGPSLRKKIIEKFQKKKSKKFSPRNRKIVFIWKRYGAFGVALLTPLIFTPIGGTLIVIAFGEKKNRIVNYMLFSAVFWSICLNIAVYFGGEQLEKILFGSYA